MNEVNVEKIRAELDPKLLHCKNTQELKPLDEIIGQERALKALKFGIEIQSKGFNIYASGLPGSGRMTAIRDFLKKVSKGKMVPFDWFYVHNFQNPFFPKAIKLPPGKGKEFQNDIKHMIDEIKRILPKVFESEDYISKKDAIIKKIEEDKKELLEKINDRARKEGFILQSTPIGIVTIPVLDGKPINDQEFMALPEKIRSNIQKKRDELISDLRYAMMKIKGLESKIIEEVQKLNREVTIYSIGHLIENLIEKYKEFMEVIKYLKDVQNDIQDNVNLFITEPKVPSIPFQVPWLKEISLRKYEINLIVDNSNLQGAPVVIELNPTYTNLIGRIEKEAQLGVLTTDFTMIRGGSLHKANGGYLVIPAEDLLINQFSYDSLKRALKNQCIEIEEVGERLGLITTKGLKPDPIPLSIKMILIGNPLLYSQLYILDRDFGELFQVKADFDVNMERNDRNIEKYAAFVCTLCNKEKLRHLNASGIAKIIEYGSRLAEDQKKLHTKFDDIANIVREANFYAIQDSSKFINSDHVTKAIEEKIYRSNLIQEKVKEMIQRNLLLIDTEGEAIGQVNGLSVINLGDFSFGKPSRVTVSIGLGKEGIIDIEREAKLGGNIHTKGVMILGGYLIDKYARDKPLSLSARIVFEQSYGIIEGDSASSAELYALLSILSNTPIKQSFAVTGSVNQKGQVQAIGGINEKIEGFFEVCKEKGLRGNQGVIIPESNEQNLMLKEEIVEAVRKGKFHIYSVKNIDEGIEILTGIKAGERLSDGKFEKGTLNYMIDEQLQEMAINLKNFKIFS